MQPQGLNKPLIENESEGCNLCADDCGRIAGPNMRPKQKKDTIFLRLGKVITSQVWHARSQRSSRTATTREELGGALESLSALGASAQPTLLAAPNRAAFFRPGALEL